MDPKEIKFPVSFELRVIFEPADGFERLSAQIAQTLTASLVSHDPPIQREGKGRYGRLGVSVKFSSLIQMRDCYDKLGQIEGVKAIL
jgi:putative lipoic acid-binding regulatory protein